MSPFTALVMRRIAERSIRLHLLRAFVALDSDLEPMPEIIDDLLRAILDADEVTP